MLVHSSLRIPGSSLLEAYNIQGAEMVYMPVAGKEEHSAVLAEEPNWEITAEKCCGPHKALIGSMELISTLVDSVEGQETIDNRQPAWDGRNAAHL